MLIAALLFSGRDWLFPSLGCLAVALLFLLWGYWNRALPLRVRIGAALLKTLGLIALALCLLEPVWSKTRPKPGANLFALMADNGQRLQIRDQGQTQTRGELLRKLLVNREAPWQTQLEEQFDVRRYVFDARLQQSRDFSELNFEGHSSAMAGALKSLVERFQGRPLAGVFLFTDGNASDLSVSDPELTGLPPIYPVVIGSDQPIKDISLQSATVTQTSFEDAPVTITATVSASGYAGAGIIAELFDSSGKKVAEQVEKAPAHTDTAGFRFQIRPDKSGISFYRLRVSARDELDQFNHPDQSKEATLANNSRILAVDRGKGPFRILYVSGRPNWEYKFLNRAVAEDDQLQLVALIRIAKREPKFDFRGRGSEASNPLFRGFDKADDTERYDQPVLVRLNTRDETELRGGFPKTPEELYGYHAVILDDLEAEFFNFQQMGLLEKFVSERGGGVLMLGGMESFHEGKFEHTPIGNLLPVYVDRVPEIAAGEWRLDLTREGWLQPWTRLRNNEADERKRLDAMPPFQVLNAVREAKPGASVLASVSDPAGRHLPALVVQRFGRGRSGALLIGDLWRYGLHQEGMQKELGKAWRQLMRWITTDVPERLEFHADPVRDALQSMLLQVRVRDQKFQPMDNASVSLEIRPQAATFDAKKTDRPGETSTNSQPIRIQAEAATSEPGLYQATFVPRQTGAYLAEASVIDSSGVPVGRTEIGWSTDPAADEFRSLKPNRALLEKIARHTGGELLTTNDLERISRKLPNRKALITETWTFPLWHTPALFLFAIACFVGEWGLRRWKGMP